MTSLDRRKFIGQAALATAAGWTVSQTARAAANAANKRVVLGVMGLSRGRSLAVGFAKLPNVQIKYVCDVDRTRAESGAELVGGSDPSMPGKPLAITDFRKILDDKQVDGLICAAPNHWHAPATILACSADKHVYVEKPCSHNPREGELMVEAARKYKKAVQVGTQRRSGGGTQEAIAKLRDGAIGRVYQVRSWYNNARGSIGKGTAAPVPDHLDFDLWQGPAPRVDYISNLVHYNWHWRWQWGNGELGNNGVHTLDLSRWGLGVDFPIRVTSSGGRYHYKDDQETPDTHTVCYEFEGGRSISWQGLSCNRHGAGFVHFYGDAGAMELDSNGSYKIFDKGDKPGLEKKGTSRGDTEHMVDFLDAIRDEKPLDLNAEIAEGHKSTLLCHLGNIAQRSGGALDCDPKNGHILNNDAAMKLWGRDYEPGWEPKV